MRKDAFFRYGEKYFTPKEAAMFLNLSLSTIKNYLYRGKLEAFKTPGGHYRISKENLIRMMRESNGGENQNKVEFIKESKACLPEQKHSSPSQQIKDYFSRYQKILQEMPIDKIEKIIDLLFDAYLKEKPIFIMGNGGSAATSSHFMVDLSKQTICEAMNKRFKVVALSDNIPSMTAWANDTSYENIFVEQLKNLHQPGAVIIAFSASGNSQNVLRALQFANDNDSMTIGLTGFNGGKLKDIAREVIIVPSDSVAQIEDMHLNLVHVVCEVLCARIKKYSMQMTGKTHGGKK